MSKLLFVDDEQMILNGLNRIFFREKDIEVKLCTSGVEALKLIPTFKPDLVVSDMRMPHMDGEEFLAKVKEIDPTIIRVILSGYSQWDVTLSMLVQGTCQWYFAKPWNKAELVSILRHLISLHNGLNNVSLLELISSFPEDNFKANLYIQLLNLLASEASIDEINDLILTDPGITLKTIQIANVAVANEPIGSVKHAIVLLGLNAIKNIVLTSELLPIGQFNPPISEAIEILWSKAILYNNYIKLIFKEIKQSNLPSKFDCIGFLLECGHILILKSQTTKCVEVVGGKVDILTNSNKLGELFKIDIKQISAYFINWWSLPSEFIEAAIYAENPSSEEYLNKEMVYICHLALHYANKHSGLDNFEIDSKCLKFFGKTIEQIEQCLK